MTQVEARRPAEDEKVKETLASSIHEQLRQDILTVEIPADSKLNIRALCERFGVGLSPVREALSRLSMEKLVTQIDHRGFKVAAFTVPDLLDLVHARSAIDGMALRQSIEAADIAWEEGLVLAYHRLSRTPRFEGDDHRRRSPKWEELHRDFHVALTAGCGSPRLMTISAELFTASERYRNATRIAGRARVRDDEHKPIMEAALAHDEETATGLLSGHYEKTGRLAEQALAAMAGANEEAGPVHCLVRPA